MTSQGLGILPGNGKAGRRRNPTATLIASDRDLEDVAGLLDAEALDRLSRASREGGTVDQISAAAEVRIAMEARKDDAYLIRHVEMLQGRLGQVVNGETLARYQRSAPDLTTAPRAVLIAEMEALWRRLALIYSVASIRDGYVTKVRKNCVLVLTVLLAAILAILFLHQATALSPLWNTVLVGVLGLSGSLTSIARRCDRLTAASNQGADPVAEAFATREAFFSLSFSALTGPVFAFVTLFLFASGIVSVAGLTPTFEPCVGDRCWITSDFRLFNYGFDFQSNLDAAKMFLWAFIAGFAERFVPAALEKLSQQ